jgi:hypothetical protein
MGRSFTKSLHVAISAFNLSSSEALPIDCSEISSVNFVIQESNIKVQWLNNQIELSKAQRRFMEHNQCCGRCLRSVGSLL